MYQTDWSLAAVTVRVPGAAVSQVATSPLDNSPAGAVNPGRPFSLPLASLAGKAGTPSNAKLWATFLPIEAVPANGRPPKGISSERGGAGAVFYWAEGPGRHAHLSGPPAALVIPAAGNPPHRPAHANRTSPLRSRHTA
jgi:hypothetical protein